MGVVLQDPFLFTGTIAHNIRLNDTSINDEQVRQAAEYVHADEFITRLPDGYDTAVRERGAGLSVGQKQLIAFARAVAFNPAMLLVLDEATANVDTETEWLIQRALERLMEGRTSIIIAHRLSTIRAGRPHPGDAQRPPGRAGHPHGAARAERPLRPAVRAAVPRPGSHHGIRGELRPSED